MKKKKRFDAKTLVMKSSFDVRQNREAQSSPSSRPPLDSSEIVEPATNPERSAVSKGGGRVLLTACDMSSVHCLMRILKAFFFVFCCLRVYVYITSEMPSSDNQFKKGLTSHFISLY